jgi:hypothetical protein
MNGTAKYCWKCKSDKPIEAFAKSADRGDGMYPLCRECAAAASRIRRARRKARLPSEIPAITEKSCWWCGNCKPTEDFADDATKADGKNASCRECASNESRMRREMLKARTPYEIPTPTQKRCQKCKLVLAAFMFGCDAGNPDGLRQKCKPCSSTESSERRERRTAKRKVQAVSKPCSRCGIVKEPEAYSRDKSMCDGLHSRCRECLKDLQREWLHKNRDRTDEEIAKATPSFKRCSHCAEVLPAAAFPKSRMVRDGLSNRCRLCRALRGKGMTVDGFRALLEKQAGCCAICNIKFRLKMNDTTEYGQTQNIYIDHDHATGQVRGLLCPKCNTAIGLLGDMSETVRKAAAYLECGGTAGGRDGC